MSLYTKYYIVVMAFCYGAIFGSFLNVVLYRWQRGISVMKPKRSFCPLCKQQIALYDNIPILSWFILRAKCRKCQGHIPARYMLVELASGCTLAALSVVTMYLSGVWS
jgi:leader peptidase (prepilin peptidase)/N-methyltransferase